MVPWRPDFAFPGFDQIGLFRNPCHGETYDITGRRIFGPSPRGLDRFPVDVKDGRVLVTVDIDVLILGDQPSRPSGDNTPAPAVPP